MIQPARGSRRRDGPGDAGWSHAREALRQGRAPRDDGWLWLYRVFDLLAPRGTARRGIVCRYYAPSRLEIAGGGRLYRWLGVPLFGCIVPTGGISIRRATGARMAPYTLRGTSLGAARDFYYRACVFETLHLPFLLTLLALAVHRASIGRWDYAVQETLMNLALNVYPIMHHRNTRRRIASLLARRGAGHRRHPDR